MKFYFYAICEVNFMISLQNMGVYIEKIKVETPHVDGPLTKNLKHQIQVDTNT